LPKWMHISLSHLVQGATEATGMEVPPAHILKLYQHNFVDVADAWILQDYGIQKHAGNITACFRFGGQQFQGQGYGALEALSCVLEAQFGCTLEVSHYDQHALMNSGTESMAQACIEVEVNGDFFAAVAIAEDTTQATLQAMLTAFSRSTVAVAAV